MFRKYMVLLRMKYVEMFAYRLATLVWMIGATVQPMITMMVWMNIYEEQADYFILYFATLVFVERMTGAWDAWELDRQIRDGTFSFSIIRPLHPIHWSIAENMVYKLLYLMVLIPVWLILIIWVPALQPHLSDVEWGLFITALLLGAVIRFMISYMFGLLGFWVTKVTALYGMFEAVSLFFSGRIAPLSLLPHAVKEASIYLPFRYMIGFPVEIATKTITGDDIIRGLSGAMLWAIGCFLLLGWLWKAGLKKNQAVGG